MPKIPHTERREAEIAMTDGAESKQGSQLNALADPLTHVRALALLEGLTLIGLVLIAVPLKYLWGQPHYVSGLGPIHGICFTLYAVMAVNLGIGRAWPWQYIARMLVAATIPFGTLLNDAWLRTRSEDGR